MIIFKNIFSFALTFKAFDWLIENHTQATPLFNALATVQLVACLLSIFMCKWTTPRQPFSSHVSSTDIGKIDVFGKQLRGYCHRHDLLAFCGLR